MFSLRVKCQEIKTKSKPISLVLVLVFFFGIPFILENLVFNYLPQGLKWGTEFNNLQFNLGLPTKDPSELAVNTSSPVYKALDGAIKPKEIIEPNIDTLSRLGSLVDRGLDFLRYDVRVEKNITIYIDDKNFTNDLASLSPCEKILGKRIKIEKINEVSDKFRDCSSQGFQLQYKGNGTIEIVKPAALINGSLYLVITLDILSKIIIYVVVLVLWISIVSFFHSSLFKDFIEKMNNKIKSI